MLKYVGVTLLLSLTACQAQYNKDYLAMEADTECLRWGQRGSNAFVQCKMMQAQKEENRRLERNAAIDRAFERNRSTTTTCMPFAGRVVCRSR